MVGADLANQVKASLRTAPKGTAVFLERETIMGAELKAMAAEIESSGKTGSQAHEAQTV